MKIEHLFLYVVISAMPFVLQVFIPMMTGKIWNGAFTRIEREQDPDRFSAMLRRNIFLSAVVAAGILAVLIIAELRRRAG